MFLFTDGSVDNQSKTGFGACLVIKDLNMAPDELGHRIQIQKFDNTSSTKLELEVFLWGLASLSIQSGLSGSLTAFTDSNNIVMLPQRRNRLEQSGFMSKNSKKLVLAEQYKKFFGLYDLTRLSLVKVKGHSQNDQKDKIAKIFTLVDKAARQALRESIICQ